MRPEVSGQMHDRYMDGMSVRWREGGGWSQGGGCRVTSSATPSREERPLWDQADHVNSEPIAGLTASGC